MEQKVGRDMSIKTKGGMVQGSLKDGLYEFLGIPYGKAERFRRAKPCSWEGVLPCVEYGNRSLQIEDGTIVGAEDCLNLNIITPDVAGKYPVLIEIHGGAFQMGSNQWMNRALSQAGRNFVHVAINYRLGALGFLHLGEDYPDSGNLGILDQIAALRWVIDNIGQFGGDPEQLTISGNSAGGKSVGALMLAPASKDLFSRAILSSGGIQAVRSQETAGRITERFLHALASVTKERTKLEDLEQMPVQQLLLAQKAMCENRESTCFFGPVADGRTIPVDWQEQIRSEEGWKGSVLLGSNTGEMVGLGEQPEFSDHIDTILFDLFGENAVYARNAFDQGGDISSKEATTRWVQILSDCMYRTHTERLADILVERGQKVWQYSFAYPPAHHAQDIMVLNGDYVQEHPELQETQLRDVRRIQQILQDGYLGMITQGSPLGHGALVWEERTKEQKSRMVLGQECRMEPGKVTDCLRDYPDFAIE